MCKIYEFGVLKPKSYPIFQSQYSHDSLACTAFCVREAVIGALSRYRNMHSLTLGCVVAALGLDSKKGLGLNLVACCQNQGWVEFHFLKKMLILLLLVALFFIFPSWPLCWIWRRKLFMLLMNVECLYSPQPLTTPSEDMKLPCTESAV